MPWSVTTLPSWASEDWAGNVSEPFRSDNEFWSSLAASADALVSLAAAIAFAVILVVAGEGAWSFVPFIAPAGLTVRAAVISRSSSRRNRDAFADRRSWRDAERTAVAAVFLKVLRRKPVSAR